MALATALDALDKQINQLRREYLTMQENQFFETMKLDLELEGKLKSLTEKDIVTAKTIREFAIDVEGTI